MSFHQSYGNRSVTGLGVKAGGYLSTVTANIAKASGRGCELDHRQRNFGAAPAIQLPTPQAVLADGNLETRRNDTVRPSSW